MRKERMGRVNEEKGEANRWDPDDERTSRIGRVRDVRIGGLVLRRGGKIRSAISEMG